MTGLVILLVALAVSAGAALAFRWKNGRFAQAVPEAAERLGAEQIGSSLGERATLVQFSSSFCSPCRATRVLLTDVAAKADGVVAVEINAEEQLALVRELNIMRTPTVLVLNAGGVVTTRASGLPSREQVLAALDRAVASS